MTCEISQITKATTVEMIATIQQATMIHEESQNRFPALPGHRHKTLREHVGISSIGDDW